MSPIFHAVTPGETLIGLGNFPDFASRQIVVAENGTTLNWSNTLSWINAASGNESKEVLGFIRFNLCLSEIQWHII
jgi:hypothetical protein